MLKLLDRIYRRFFPKRMKDYPEYQTIFSGLKGMEVGGPSVAFSSKSFLPIYNVIAGLDGCNFSGNTVWEGDIKEGQTFRYENKIGRQYIADATDLSQIKDKTYDFVLSCHSLEHIANPIKALNEWIRIIRDDGYVLMIMPHKDRTFDNKRPVTTLDHMVSDFEQGTTEDDSTHFEDAIKLHDLSEDPGVKDYETLVERIKNNIDNRCLHHHVFNTPVLLKLLDFVNLKILKVSHFSPYHIIVLSQKVKDRKADNSSILNPANPIYINSPFPSDRL